MGKDGKKMRQVAIYGKGGIGDVKFEQAFILPDGNEIKAGNE